jgi:hypothetical protein
MTYRIMQFHDKNRIRQDAAGTEHYVWNYSKRLN